ncbi:MaoC family dehydratase [Streptomonospora sp. PA3]|uniref:MaoC family dehydratase N-terminal domain-containing protein n=1 Tax=Streptomonospora sp. PA3 TaxID=2607326 RepID=UPI0012DC5337|nr:MaoC family dehydratase N-terminal domain-containing protein [Streptomonospora sp. PA3]MUL41929.1 MaoC family dehydratase [Streptomonospora sp. PA3]
MGINREHVGREYRSPQPYEVTRGKIREFAEAIGDPNPIYIDTATARAAGYGDVIAPPTFPVIMGMEGMSQAVVDPELRLDFSMVVHGDQSFAYQRPLQAGDVVETVTRIADIAALGGNERLTLESEMRTAEGELVVTAVNMLVVRGAAEEAGAQGAKGQGSSA